jgi:hypothetical protein
MDILDYYEVVTSKIFKLESMNEGLVFDSTGAGGRWSPFLDGRIICS